jgi:tRNA pseudouridine13 synthase
MLTLVKAGYRNIPKTQIRIDSLLKTRFIAAVSGKALTSPTMITRALSGPDLEQSVGIEVYSTDTSGFRGVIKQRYSDFIVREIDIYNRIARLEKTDGMAVEKAAFAVAQSDSADSVEAVDAYLTDLTTLGIAFDDTACREFLLECVNQSDHTNFQTEFVSFEGLSKELRTAVHKGVKHHLPSTVNSDAVQKDGKTLIALRIKKRGQKVKRTRFEWPDNLGEYLKFVVLKENIDTMNAVNTVAKFMHIKPANIAVAGTKDKRAVTAQWFTVYRRRPSEVMPLNKFKYSPIIRVGDFEYVKEPLKMGAALGNRFEIILRDISVSESEALKVCSQVRERGFVNYFGLQRFGKSNSHTIGLNIMKKNWQHVIDLILSPKYDEAPEVWQVAYSERRFDDALRSVPDHFFIEKSIIEGLCTNKTDIFGAFNRSPKQSRLICFHAYQSYIWNKVVSVRLKRYGFRCVVGDLVFTGDSRALDTATSDESNCEMKLEGQVRILTEKDLEFADIRDVVMPLPGYEVSFL